MAGQNVLMLTKDDEEVEVEPNDFDTAMQSGLEPALEYVDKDGGVNVVRKSHAKDAEKAGLVHKPIYDSKQAAKTGIKVGAGEAAARGFANNATFGFADEIGAGVKHPMGAVKSLAKDLPLVGKYLNDDSGDASDIAAYQGERNAYRMADDAAWDQNKLAYGAGAALPAVASLIAPVGVAATAGKSAVTEALKQGAKQGAITAAGGGTDYGSDVDLTKKGQLMNYLEKVAMGGGIGAGAGVAGTKLAQAATKGAKGLANRFAYRATGGMKSDMNKLHNKTYDKVGETLLDEDLIPWFAKRGGKKIEDNLEGALDKFSGQQDDLLSGLDMKGAGAKVSKIEEDMLAEIRDLASKPGVANKKAAAAMQAELDDFIQTVGKTKPGMQNVSPKDVGSGPKSLMGELADAPNELNLMDALGIKRGYDKAGKYQSQTDTAAVNAARKIRSTLNDSIDDEVGNLLGAGEAAAYKKSRSKASDLIDSLDATQQSQARNASNKPFGLTDTIAAAGTIGAGLSAPQVVLALGAKKLTEAYGDAFAANALNLFTKHGPQEALKRLSQVVGPQEAERIYMTLTGK